MNSHYIPIEMFVAGEWIGSNQFDDIFDPATGNVIGSVPIATADVLDRALEAASGAFKPWRDLSPESRAVYLLKAAQLIRERTDQIASILTLEQGKILAEAKAEVARAAAILEWDVAEGLRAYGRIIPGAKDFTQMAIRQAIGPVAAFTPWNFPAGSPGRKLGGALAAGCTIIIKAAEETPGTACALVRCFDDAGIPAGVVNLVFGIPSDVSRHLIGSDIVRLVTFTGSIPVGKQLATLAAQGVKPALLELGGHCPVIVSETTNADVAAKASAAAKFRNAGQICSAPTRFFVHENVYNQFVSVFTESARALRVGNGFDTASQMGPLANVRRVETMQRLVADAVTKGARLATGGARIGNEGQFFEPTILSDVPADALVMNEEPFGPIAAITPFRTLDDAIDRANGLPFGLSSYAFTESAVEVQTLAREMESGTVAINHLGGSQPSTPFGGVKESGYGREGGSESLESYMVTKFVSHRASL